MATRKRWSTLVEAAAVYLECTGEVPEIDLLTNSYHLYRAECQNYSDFKEWLLYHMD